MKYLLLTLFFSVSIFAQDKAQRDALVGALFEAPDAASFEKAFAAAKAGRIPDQILVEARFLYLVDYADRAALAAFAPTLKEQLKKDQMSDSVIFAVKEDFLAVHEYTLALGALEKNNSAAFKKHITEAFWLSPRQATAFAPHIDRLRRDQALAKLRIDFDRSFMRQKDGQKVALQVLARQSDHLVIHFWSPWSTESEDHLPDFLAMVKELSSHGIPVASVLIEPGKEALAEAKKFRAAITAGTAEVWIVDNSRESLARKLRVLELPTITVLKVDGSVLFSGHPSEKKLWSTLQSINPELSRPRVKLIP